MGEVRSGQLPPGEVSEGKQCADDLLGRVAVTGHSTPSSHRFQVPETQEEGERESRRRSATMPTSSLDLRDAVTILVASTNDRDVIELCVKTLFLHTETAFRLIVLDSAVRYSPIPLLEELKECGALDLLPRPGRLWTHGEAHDEMIASVETPLFVTLDSYIEILRGDWLELLVNAMDDATDMVCAQEFSTTAEVIGDTEWVVPGGKKFTIWMSLYRTEAVRRHPTPFAPHQSRPDGITPAGRRKMLYTDTGVDLYRRLRAQGRARELPALHTGGYYRHWGAMSNAGYFLRRLFRDRRAPLNLLRQLVRHHRLVRHNRRLSTDLCLKRAIHMTRN